MGCGFLVVNSVALVANLDMLCLCLRGWFDDLCSGVCWLYLYVFLTFVLSWWFDLVACSSCWWGLGVVGFLLFCARWVG